ncbi:multidrug MFS transporter [Frankia sp. R43]|uniref:MFS transporter n=1 Tax=Frankia sp. R43 TaxID=269536 RepID=UPI0006CA4705|nr:MFS transporter [Frankia sp. R43]KPM51110.1 multidrug MFS transporter [Frankia sp. R43]
MRKWLPLVAICLGTFMLLVDITIVTVALPDIATSLDASFSDLQWVMDVYALALAALLLGAGAIADLRGQRRVYLGGLILFAVASLACGLAPGAGTLVVARGMQGIGGAAMFATTMALIASTYRGRDLGVAFGIWGAVNGAAAAIGPVLGGLLTEHVSWRAIFLVNLPVSVAAAALTLAVVGEFRRPDGPRVDLAGTVTFTVSAAALVYGLIRAGEHGWGSAGTLGLFALSAVALVLFLMVESRIPHPLLELGLFRRGGFVAALIAGLTLSAAAFSVLTFTSVWLQAVLGHGPVRAGLAMLPMALAAFVVAGLGGRFLHAASPRLTIGVGMLLVGAGSVALSRLDAGSDSGSLQLGLLVTGIGVGLAIPALSAAAMSAVPPQRGGMAAGALNTFRQLGFALGIAVFGLLFHNGIRDQLSGHVANPDTVAAAIGQGQAARDVPPAALSAIRAAVPTSLGDVYLIAAIVAFAAGIAVFVLMPRAVAHLAENAQPADGRSADVQPADGRSADGRSAAGRPDDGQSAGGKSDGAPRDTDRPVTHADI